MDFYRAGRVGFERLCGGLNQDCARAVPDEMDMAPPLAADGEAKFLAIRLSATRGCAWNVRGRAE